MMQMIPEKIDWSEFLETLILMDFMMARLYLSEN